MDGYSGKFLFLGDFDFGLCLYRKSGKILYLEEGFDAVDNIVCLITVLFFDHCKLDSRVENVSRKNEVGF